MTWTVRKGKHEMAVNLSAGEEQWESERTTRHARQQGDQASSVRIDKLEESVRTVTSQLAELVRRQSELITAQSAEIAELKTRLSDAGILPKNQGQDLFFSRKI